MGRIRAAWAVLMGQKLTPQQMAIEWQDIQATAAEMFSRFNSLASRLVRAEKNLVKRQMELLSKQEEQLTPCQGCDDDAPPEAMGGDRQSRKSQLRRLAFGRVQTLPSPHLPNGRPANNVDGDQSSAE